MNHSTRLAITLAAAAVPGLASAQLTWVGNQYWHQDSDGLAETAEASDQFGHTQAFGDFNGDGFLDAAIGSPEESLGAAVQTGMLHIVYGSSDGLVTTNSRLFHQGQLDGIGDVAEIGDRFASALAVGNFDGDEYDDLVIGIPNEDLGAVADAGQVTIIYGDAPGLISANAITITQADVGGVSEAGDLFGFSLATGDFGNDGFDDLVIGSPGEGFGAAPSNAGVVTEIYGRSSGLNLALSVEWNQDSPGIEGEAMQDDLFGWTLLTADFNGDLRDDLAISAIGEAVGSQTMAGPAGAVNVIYGGNIGLGSPGNQLWSQDTPGVEGVAEAGDEWGWSLAAADFDGNERDDLVVGSRFEPVGSREMAGAVQVFYSNAAGVSTTDVIINGDFPGLPGAAVEGDWFGQAVAAGDFDNDGFGDLAIGIPFDDIGTMVLDAGQVQILYGRVTGLDTNRNQRWSQNSRYVLGVAETGEAFGSSLVAADINNDGFTDLSVGVIGDLIGDKDAVDGGAINILFGADVVFADDFGPF
ncbi:MAG: hypothetical protein DHS20C11_37940 [Lysobacteraceae bacterium]|nr:MAG: hypothetical protein DHS20C11_37940 [Xanthomonadaceae bacterium]